MKIHKPCAVAVLSCMLMTGCGGDGDGRPAFRADRSTAQGLYDGTIVYNNLLSFNQQTIVLETGEFFIVYGETLNNTFFVDGMLHGTGQISANSNTFYSYDLSDHFFRNNAINAVFNGRLTASFEPGNFFNGNARQQDSTADFQGAAPQAAVYTYNTAANLNDVIGDWVMIDLLGNQPTMSITAPGSFSGIYPNGCSFSGSLTPRLSGKNVFNMAITFGPTPCTQPNQSFSGVAFDYAPSTQSRTLVMAGLTVSGDQATVLYGIR
jgi:hypothetical protein